ncbi:WG containing repeat-containing protein [Formosa sp. Hel1_31_208]|uniref:WG repeat-containing protein n=1 Tax=Formosa sp. Hel1_31_208 TaxID=1798225 RepID=UPI00087CD87A|nr:WG repeat-containing protein [Formosa sp. Hel1_31_208]SDS17754.1 WG containing repeat-containing protein [Formosa sp. Hel1_31_208]
MKTLKNLLLCALLIPFITAAQPLEGLDFVSPFYDGLAAVKKNNEWAFINEKGELAINFRSDLVATPFGDDSYPVFKNQRCLISEIENGISYFGYIDVLGNIIIEPQYLNATNFENGRAVVLELMKEYVGKNDALDKNVAYDKYLEAAIDTNGSVLHYVTPERYNVLLDKKFLKCPPTIRAKYISNTLYAHLNDDATWTLISIE